MFSVDPMCRSCGTANGTSDATIPMSSVRPSRLQAHHASRGRGAISTTLARRRRANSRSSGGRSRSGRQEPLSADDPRHELVVERWMLKHLIERSDFLVASVLVEVRSRSLGWSVRLRVAPDARRRHRLAATRTCPDRGGRVEAQLLHGDADPAPVEMGIGSAGREVEHEVGVSCLVRGVAEGERGRPKGEQESEHQRGCEDGTWHLRESPPNGSNGSAHGERSYCAARQYSVVRTGPGNLSRHDQPFRTGGRRARREHRPAGLQREGTPRRGDRSHQGGDGPIRVLATRSSSSTTAPTTGRAINSAPSRASG